MLAQKNPGRVHVKSDEAKDVRWMSWFDHSLAWDKAWTTEYLTTMWSLWESGENVFSETYFSKSESDNVNVDTAQEVYSIKGMRWQALEGNSQSRI